VHEYFNADVGLGISFTQYQRRMEIASVFKVSLNSEMRVLPKISCVYFLHAAQNFTLVQYL